MSYVVRETNGTKGFWESIELGTFANRVDAVRFAAESAVDVLTSEVDNLGFVAGFEVIDEYGEILDQYDTSQDRLEIWHAA